MLEYWNCIEVMYFTVYKKRLSLQTSYRPKHKYSKEDARQKALAARRGDIDNDSQYYEDECVWVNCWC